MTFDKEKKETWIADKIDTLLDEEATALLSALPPDMLLSIRALVHHGFHKGYDWGFNHGRSFTGSGIEPTYYVAEPKVRLQTVDESRDVA